MYTEHGHTSTVYSIQTVRARIAKTAETWAKLKLCKIAENFTLITPHDSLGKCYVVGAPSERKAKDDPRMNSFTVL